MNFFKKIFGYKGEDKESNKSIHDYDMKLSLVKEKEGLSFYIEESDKVKKFDMIPAKEMAKAAYNEGVDLLQKGKHQEATKKFQVAISYEPSHLNAHYNLALTFFETGNYDEARKEYEVVLEFNPEDVEALNNLGVIYVEKRQLDMAKLLFDRAFNVDPDFALTHQNLAAYYQGIGDSEKMNEHIKRSIEFNK